MAAPERGSRMLLELHRPGPPLSDFVELITFYEGYCPDHAKQRLLPDGAVEIVIDLCGPPKRLFDRADWSRFRAFRHAWISGMRREWIVIEAARGSSMAVIRFRPGGAYPVLGFPLSELTGAVEPLDDVLGARVGSLRDRVLAAATPADKFAAIEGWLLERARGRLAAHPCVRFLAERLMHPGERKIGDLVDDVGFSQKHVISLFKRWVGLTPKQFCRIRKFQTVVARLETASGPLDWADVAQRAGYYDQAHLINEFRSFSGLSPRAYRDARGEYPNYLPLDPLEG